MVSVLTIDEAVGVLDALGSSCDPIIYRGKETTPDELSHWIGGTKSAGRVRIKFYGKRSRVVRLTSGTLRQMCLDRLVN